jgi:tetratricopeptide (TPR) repeat protein
VGLRELQAAMDAAGEAGVEAMVAIGDVQFEVGLLPGRLFACAERLRGAAGACAHRVPFHTCLILPARLPQSGNLVAAKQAYRRAAQRAPAPGLPRRAQLRLARCFLASGDAAAAADAFLAAAASGGGSQGAAAWLGAACAAARLGDAKGADRALAAASRADPRHPGVWGEVARAALEAGREEEGAQALRQALRFHLANPQLLAALADACAALGRHDLAAPLLPRLACVPGGAPGAARRMGEASLAAGDLGGAAAHLAAARAALAGGGGGEAAAVAAAEARLAAAWPRL